MQEIRRIVSAAAVIAAGAWPVAGLGAQQVTEVSRTALNDQAQVTFGYLCDDRFVVRNDGTRPIDLEYGVEKGNEHTKLGLNGREAVELESKGKAPVELWMDGKLIAKAYKERRSCRDVRGNSQVSVAPLEVKDETPRRDPYTYGPPYPFYDPWAFGMYSSFAYRPYYGARAVVSFPIIIGGRGGRRH